MFEGVSGQDEENHFRLPFWRRDRARGFPAAETVSLLGMGNRPLGSVSLTVWERSAPCGTGCRSTVYTLLTLSHRLNPKPPAHRRYAIHNGSSRSAQLLRPSADSSPVSEERNTAPSFLLTAAAHR
ncbi:hypothetical protein EYF80_021537 [Liparis tanakae]|uniref:Uncharacterized protein n=1 Tax=Liparis tanakae TaxID=230148 RepID=A0A4Z2HSF5_9TELE|nr:hypothetical protein EYF80_021537 [Liparis tanakae]